MGKCNYVWITIFMVLCYVGYLSQISIMTQYVYHRLALKFNLSYTNQSTCSNNLNYTDKNYNYVQTEAANINIYAQLASGVPSLITVIFSGIISDIKGRKKCLAITWVFLAVGSIFNVVLVATDGPLYLYIIGQFITGCGGSYGSILTGVFSLVSDLTDNHQRNYAIVIIEFTISLSMIISQFVLGIWLETKLFLGPIATFTFLLLLSGPVGLMIKEKALNKTRNKHLGHNFNKIYKVFVINHKWNILLCLLLTTFFLHTFNFLGNLTILVLFFFGRPFCWSSSLLGYFRSVSTVIVLSGTFGSLFLLRLGMHELAIVQLGFLTSIVSKVLLVIAPFFAKPIADKIAFASLSDVFSGASVSLLRSIASKKVSPDDHGTMFGVMSSLETLGGLLGGVVYNAIYAATFHVLYGAIYVFNVGLITLAVILMTIYCFYQRSHPTTISDSQENLIS